MKRYFVFTENNDWEGESWSMILMTTKEDKVEKFIEMMTKISETSEDFFQFEEITEEKVKEYQKKIEVGCQSQYDEDDEDYECECEICSTTYMNRYADATQWDILEDIEIETMDKVMNICTEDEFIEKFYKISNMKEAINQWK